MTSSPRVIRIDSVNLGRVARWQIDGRSVTTAYGKRPVTEPVAVGPLGLAGDEQADPTVHGGRSKAVYAYPREHLAFWQTVRRQAKVDLPQVDGPGVDGAAAEAAGDWPLPPGAMGENLTISGALEADLWVGDRLELPGCVLAVSEPRRPCFKFSHAMGFKQAGSLMNQSGWCGSYLAVLEPGTLQVGQQARLVPGPREVNIRELFLAKVNKRASWR